MRPSDEKKALRKKDKDPPKGEPTVHQWLQRIERAAEVKKEWRERFRIDLAYDYYDGVCRPPWWSDEEWYTLPWVFEYVQAELPSLYAQDPYFYVKLKRTFQPAAEAILEYEARGKLRQSFLNYLKDEIHLKDACRSAIQDTLFQFGICKVYLESDVFENPSAGQPILTEDGEPLLQDGSPMEEPEILTADETYRIERLHPDDFLVDEDAGPTIHDVAWKAQRIVRSIEEVKEDLRYDKKARESIRATSISKGQEERQKRKKRGILFEKPSEEPDLAVLWEIYDLRKEEWLVVSEGSDRFLVEPSDLPAGIEGSPFVDLRFCRRDDSWYPIPIVSQMLDIMREACISRSQVVSHRKRFNRKYVLYRQAFDDAEQAAIQLTDGDDGTVLIADVNPGYAPIAPIQDAPLDGTNQYEMAALRSDFADIALGSNQRGSGSGVDSATEAGIIAAQTSIRQSDRQAQVVDFLTSIARKLDQLVQPTMTREQAVRVAGPQGEQWVVMDPRAYEDIEGEYEYAVSTGSTVPQVPEIERQQLMAFLASFGSIPQIFTDKQILQRVLDKFGLGDDEVLIDGLVRVATATMQGAMPPPTASGSIPGAPAQPEAVQGGPMGLANMRGGNFSEVAA